MDRYHIALFIHLFAFLVAAGATATTKLAAGRLARAKTVADALDWHSVLSSASKLFPLCTAALVLTGSYMLSFSNAAVWRSGFVVAGLTGVVLLLVIGGFLGAKGKAVHQRLEQLAAQNADQPAPKVVPPPIVAALPLINTGIALSVGFDMVTKPASVSAALGIVAIGIVLGAAVGLRRPALAGRPQPRRCRRRCEFAGLVLYIVKHLTATKTSGQIQAGSSRSNPESDMHLDIRGISKTYPNGVQALKDVSLSIPPGMYGLLGPNGAGKSTLMRILATLQEPDSGSIRLGDIDVVEQKDEVRKTLGYLPQEFGVYPKVSAEELLDHFALLKGVGERRARKAVVDALLRQVNLWDVRRQKLGGYSGGMRQRFGVAVALLGNPKLMIVDEPTAGLDPAERVRFLNLLSELGENSVVLLSTHIVEDVSELCIRMAIIDRGEILLEAEPLRAVADLHGRVWRQVISKQELPALERDHAVISTKLLAGRTLVRIYSDSPPGAGFESAEAALEDVYFSTMTGHIGRRREQQESLVAS